VGSRCIRVGVLAALLSATASLRAQVPPPAEPVPPPAEPPHRYPRAERLYFDVPALDLRENAVIGFWPSMRQSLAITKDAYYLWHTAILAIPYPENFPRELATALDYALIGVSDIVTVYVPPFMGWMHEEWHRAVMSRRGIKSTNDIYDLPFFRSLINVSHVTDADLVRLKREHPADQVRMSSAGIEGDFALGTAFDKDRFFYDTRAATLFAEWMGTLNAIGYMQTAAFDSDGNTERQNIKEGTNVPRRDFTGLDPDGWVYDLFRPNEPYEARGVHPSGVGLDRYRSGSDLTARERRYLDSQARLSWLNLANPNLFGFYYFKLGAFDGAPARFNASLHHVMAPFGYTLGLNLFAKAGRYRAFGELRAFVSESLVLPGLSFELLRYPLPWLEATLSPRVRLWLQPKHQLFFERSVAPGGSLEARVSVPLLPALEAYVEGAGKTAGFIPGEVFLNWSLNVRTGLEIFLF
jgi:hypothetical protein